VLKKPRQQGRTVMNLKKSRFSMRRFIEPPWPFHCTRGSAVAPWIWEGKKVAGAADSWVTPRHKGAITTAASFRT